MRHGPTSVLGCHAADLRSHLSGETGPSETPRCLVEWKGPGAQWSCHCCNRLNEETTRKCLTCGRSSAYCEPSCRGICGYSRYSFLTLCGFSLSGCAPPLYSLVVAAAPDAFAILAELKDAKLWTAVSSADENTEYANRVLATKLRPSQKSYPLHKISYCCI